jgi:phage FluMu protein Com
LKKNECPKCHTVAEVDKDTLQAICPCCKLVWDISFEHTITIQYENGQWWATSETIQPHPSVAKYIKAGVLADATSLGTLLLQVESAFHYRHPMPW